jgi:dihydropyrimidinase
VKGQPLLIENGLIVTNEGLRRGDVLVTGSRIEAIGTDLPRSAPVIDATGCYVLPGLVDPHVHVAHPGETGFEPLIEDLEAASRSALVGGVTTLCVYVARTAHSTLIANIRREIEVGRETAWVDFGINALCRPGDDFEEVVRQGVELGVTSFKAMLAYPERGMMLEDDDLLRLIESVADVDALLLVHPANGRASAHLEARERQRSAVTDASYLRTSPGVLEAEGIFRTTMLSRIARCRVLFVHLSSREAVETFAWLKARDGDRVRCETQPHYLCLTNTQVLSRGALAKIAPPLGEEADVVALWDALRTGLISHLSSDHSPRDILLKRAGRDILEAPYGGVSGVPLLLPLAHYLLMERGGFRIEDLVRLTATNPAKSYGLYPRKGLIHPGADADLVILPEEADPVTIRADAIPGPSDYSLYEGITSRGFPRYVIRAGRLAVADGATKDVARGTYLPRVPGSASWSLSKTGEPGS